MMENGNVMREDNELASSDVVSSKVDGSPYINNEIAKNKDGYSQKDKLKEITDKLEAGIKAIFESGQYLEYLKTMARFHHYSPGNVVLIHLQKPYATLCAGFKKWESMGRHVIKGRKGAKIIAPKPYKKTELKEKLDPTTQKPIIGENGKPLREYVTITVPAYGTETIFDISDTEGPPLPELGHTLMDDVKDFPLYMDALREAAPVPLVFSQIEGDSVKGYYHSGEKKIYIREDMGELQKIKTGIHEIAHSKLHDKDVLDDKETLPDKRTREVQAESIAYVVSTYYGLDTSDYSFGYIAGWSKDKELPELKASLNVIRKTAAEIIDTIAKSLERMREQTLASSKHSEVDTADRVYDSYIPLPPTPIQTDTLPIKIHGRGH